MENFGGLFMLAIIGIAAWYIDGYYKEKSKNKKQKTHVPAQLQN